MYTTTIMGFSSRVQRAAAAMLMGASALASVVLTPATASAGADDRATGPFTWCPGQYQSFNGEGNHPNWDWNACHTYWWVYGPQGNVAHNVWEGVLPPNQVPLENLTRPPVNCGLFYCQDPGGRYTVDPRLPTP